MRRLVVPVILGAFLVACASSTPPGPLADGGPALDGGSDPIPDGGDDGVPEDGGPDDDGGAPDAGFPESDGGPECPLPARDGGVTDPNWIGGACSGDADCTYDGGVCLGAADGFPGGMCTLPCTSICPDRAGPDNATTFCVASATSRIAGGMCVSQCNFGIEPLGCRTGYHCATKTRVSDSSAIRNACVSGPPTCYETLSDYCLPYRAVANPLAHPSDCSTPLCDVVDATYFSSTIGGIVYRNSAGNPPDLFGRCALALALERLAPILIDKGVVEVNHYGTYNCRLIAGTTCSLSQHGKGLAIDLASFKLQDGTIISVLDDWEPTTDPTAVDRSPGSPCRFDYTPGTEKAAWLYDLAYRMCDEHIWSIILTPSYNDAHRNHFHVDLTAGYSQTFLGSPGPTVLRMGTGGE